jgi:outer membrane murein-binding lipoprotein Lpp
MSVLIGSAISAGVSIIGGIIGGGKARRAKRKAARNLKKMNAKMANLEANRQEIINPYEDVTSLSGMMSNPMANLSVATQATEMQIEQTDQALANTLDTLRQTGGGCG